MGTRNIRRGATQTISGTVTAATKYLILGGTAGYGSGGTGLITGAVTNHGIIELAGGAGAPRAGAYGGLGGTLEISGTLTSDGGITLDAGAAPTGAGTNAGYGGALFLSGALTNSGSMTIAGSTSFPASDAFVVVEAGIPTAPGSHNPGGTLTNTGTLNNAGVILVEGTPQTDFTAGTKGTHDDAGTLINIGVLTNNNEIVLGGGGGTANVFPGSEDGASYIYNQGAQLLNSGMLVNNGSILVQAGAPPYGAPFGSSGAGATLLDSGILTNNGSIDIAGAKPSSQAYCGGLMTVTGSLANIGDISIDAGLMNAGFASEGAILINGGTVTNSGAITANGGDFSDPGGVISLRSGTLTNNGLIELRNGVVAYENLTTTTDGGAHMGVGGVLLNYGTLEVDAGAYYYYHDRVNSATNATLDISSTGLLNVEAGGKLALNGTLTLTGSLIVSGANGSAAAGRIAMQSGILAIESGGVLTNGGTITLSQHAYIGYYNAFGSQTDGTFINNGLISGSDGTIDSASLVNNGTIEALGTIGDTLIIVSDITSTTGHGLLQVDAGASLALFGTASSSQTISLLGPTSTVYADPSDVSLLIQSSSGGTLNIFGGTSILNANDTNLTVGIFGGNLTLSHMAFVTAIGGNASETITAGANGQTLTGGLGVDHLYGTTIVGTTGVLFKDTAAGLNGDYIGSFIGKDAIDIVDMARTGAHLTYTPGAGQGTLVVSNGALSTSITLLGSYTTASFVLGQDSSGHAMVTLHG